MVDPGRCSTGGEECQRSIAPGNVPEARPVPRFVDTARPSSARLRATPQMMPLGAAGPPTGGPALRSVMTRVAYANVEELAAAAGAADPGLRTSGGVRVRAIL